MTSVRDILPSMFVRRVLLLFAGFLAAAGILAVQAANLTILRGDASLEEAESRLVTTRWTETVRGRILDRKGRVLARDEASFDVLVDYQVITEEWAVIKATQQVRRSAGEDWLKFSDAERTRLIEQAIAPWLNHLDRMWDELAAILQIPRDELDQRRYDITAKIHPMASRIREWQRQRREERLNEGRKNPIEITLAEVWQPIAEERKPHVIAESVPDSMAALLRRLTLDPANYPGLSIRPSGKRTYPLETMEVEVDRSSFPLPLRNGDQPQSMNVVVEGVATHILGWMKTAQREDIDAREKRIGPLQEGEIDRGQYREGDIAGAWGIEAGWEDTLRGLRGLTVQHLDTGVEEVTPDTPGVDVQLTIDAVLQAKIQGMMDPRADLARVHSWHKGQQELTLPIGTPLTGAAVVVEVQTGDILAMVSTPSFTREQYFENPSQMWDDPIDHPAVNKALAKPYPPGSIVKPLILCAAVTQGVFSLGEGIECHGHLYENNTEGFRCWIYKQFHRTHSGDFGGALHGRLAIEVSCNVFFYTLGRRLGFEKIADWYKRFNAGAAGKNEQPWGLGAGIEYAGNAGQKYGNEPPQLQDAIFMGMGQGPVAWTPLHAANSYATLARGGEMYFPRMVKSPAQPIRGENLNLDPDAVDDALAGLHGVVNGDYGTGRWLNLAELGTREQIFNAKGVTVWGKTGTAEAPKVLGEDPDGNGPLKAPELRFGDHSWFVVLAGPEGGKPKYAIAVIMEYAGSGGRVSGPICNQIIHILQSEGYL